LLAVLIALLIGTILGLVNGLTVSYLKIPPLIATLGMMSIARGLQLTHTLGATLYSFPKAFSYIGTALWLGVPAPIYLVIIVFILFHLIMKYTTLGRSIYAIGGNAEAARISGISVRKTILFTYAISGLLTAVGGLLLLARMDAAESSAGQGLEMEAIAAVVIGGTSLTGGRGTVLKTALGTLIYGVIINGLNIIGVNPFVQKIVIGLLILGAVGADCVLRYRKGER
jgi:ribose transport system permease protein